MVFPSTNAPHQQLSWGLGMWCVHILTCACCKQPWHPFPSETGNMHHACILFESYAATYAGKSSPFIAWACLLICCSCFVRVPPYSAVVPLCLRVLRKGFKTNHKHAISGAHACTYAYVWASLIDNVAFVSVVCTTDQAAKDGCALLHAVGSGLMQGACGNANKLKLQAGKV